MKKEMAELKFNKKAIAFHSGASLHKKLTFRFKFTFNGEILQYKCIVVGGCYEAATRLR